VRSAIATDEDLNEALRRRYLFPLDVSTRAEEITTSLRAYFTAGRHVDQAAAELSVHPNTLRYRLVRFEELTGTRLRDPLVALEVWWALEAESMRQFLEESPK
jgi:DNA-binding PucR family transcriptional regulator